MSVKDHIIPKRVFPVSLFQARIDRKIYQALTNKLRKEAVSLRVFVEAAAQDYLTDKEDSCAGKTE